MEDRRYYVERLETATSRWLLMEMFEDYEDAVKAAKSAVSWGHYSARVVFVTEHEIWRCIQAGGPPHTTEVVTDCSANIRKALREKI